ncbi:MAG: helix-turn-helix transcriptional regulator [Planctomycetes bacterium]|nr:helix-turn-helix transcriptional regulator [Planctomycetota bacterium]
MNLNPRFRVELDDFQTRFAKVLLRHRLLLRLNQEELAEKAGLHRTHVSILERKRQVPSMVAVLKIASAIGVTLTELFREVESDQRPGEEPPAIPKGRPRKDKGTPAGLEKVQTKKNNAGPSKRRSG